MPANASDKPYAGPVASADHKPSVKQVFYAVRCLLELDNQPFNAATVSDLIARTKLATPVDPVCFPAVIKPTPAARRRKSQSSR